MYYKLLSNKNIAILYKFFNSQFMNDKLL